MSKVNRRDFVQNLNMTAKRMHCKMRRPSLQRRGISWCRLLGTVEKVFHRVVGADLYVRP